MAYDFQKAKSEMDFELRRLGPEIEGNNVYGVKVPIKHPLLIARGKNAVVFKLPESGLVAKGSFYACVPDDRNIQYFMLSGQPNGGFLGHYMGGLKETLKNLYEIEMDKDVLIPEMQEHACKINLYHEKRIYYTLMPDLRENGKYQLSDAEDFTFDSYGFGNQLHDLYEESCDRIMQACKSGIYEIICAGHGSEENPEPAIRHMFLVQFNDIDGRICAADLNHLLIHRR